MSLSLTLLIIKSFPIKLEQWEIKVRKLNFDKFEHFLTWQAGQTTNLKVEDLTSLQNEPETFQFCLKLT